MNKVTNKAEQLFAAWYIKETLVQRILRKTAAQVSVTYNHGNFSNNLNGTDFLLNESEVEILLTVDLSSNLHVRNQSSNCYSDAIELASDYSKLDMLQIDEQQIIDALVSAKKKNPNAPWFFQINLGEKGLFKFSVTPTLSNGSLFFNVC